MEWSGNKGTMVGEKMRGEGGGTKDNLIDAVVWRERQMVGREKGGRRGHQWLTGDATLRQ